MLRDISWTSFLRAPLEANRSRILLILLIVLAIYFPAVSDQINSIDDSHIIAAYENSGRSLIQVLSPYGKFYYRPLIELSFFLDDLLWDLDPLIMHLENILLHALNALLVYQLAKKLPVVDRLPSLPFVSSLLFALHPMQTEAVSWIAGRTDPLAAFFVLAGLNFFLRWRLHRGKVDLVLATALILLSLLTKETAVALILALPLIYYSWGRHEAFDRSESYHLRIFIGVLVVSVATVFSLLWKFPKLLDAVSTVLSRPVNWYTDLPDGMKYFGYYVRKFFVPYPLNFAIYSVNMWYAALGGLATLVVLYFTWKKCVLGTALVTGSLFMLPPVVAGVAGINWTPVAERYLYLPTAFLSIAFSGFVLQSAALIYKKQLAGLFFTIIVLLFSFITFNRNVIWRSNFTLYSDAVKKSPNFGDIHLELGGALAKKGQYDEAVPHFRVAEQLSKRQTIREYASMNLLFCGINNKPLNDKRKMMNAYVANKDYVHPDIIRTWRDIDKELLKKEDNLTNRAALMNEIMMLNDRLYRVTKDTVCLYTNAQISLVLGKKERALELFRQTVAEAPPGAYYFDSAQKLTAQLERK